MRSRGDQSERCRGVTGFSGGQRTYFFSDQAAGRNPYDAATPNHLKHLKVLIINITVNSKLTVNPCVSVKLGFSSSRLKSK